MAFLSIKSLSVFYEKAIALNNITIDILKGELVAIIGPNGAGKTTLLKAISGLIPSQGEIIFENDKLHNKKAHEIVKAGIIQCPERRQLFEEFTVYDNLLMGAFLRKDRKKIENDLEKVFALFPILKERRKQQAGLLSGGEQQMVAIGRSLLSKPTLLMMDEPVIGLSPLVKENLSKSILDIWKSGVTILLVEQDSYMAMNLSERIYIIENGKIRISGESSKLINDDDLKRAYFM